MHPINRWLVRFFGIAFLVLTGCASLTQPNHTFDFDPRRDSPDIRVLDWKYSMYGPFNWEYDMVSKDESAGLIGLNVTGRFSVGDFIYVKWRAPPDLTIHERRIELKNLLPFSMEGRRIRLSFDGNEPVVYLISPDKSEPGFVSFRGRGYIMQRIEQIYPGPKKRIAPPQNKS